VTLGRRCSSQGAAEGAAGGAQIFMTNDLWASGGVCFKLVCSARSFAAAAAPAQPVEQVERATWAPDSGAQRLAQPATGLARARCD